MHTISLKRPSVDTDVVKAEKVLPCPYDGYHSGFLEIQLVEDVLYNRYYVTCRACSCRGPLTKTAVGAVDAWNIRKQGRNPECEKPPVDGRIRG